jgi:hypothetical protein
MTFTLNNRGDVAKLDGDRETANFYGRGASAAARVATLLVLCSATWPSLRPSASRRLVTSFQRAARSTGFAAEEPDALNRHPRIGGPHPTVGIRVLRAGTLLLAEKRRSER